MYDTDFKSVLTFRKNVMPPTVDCSIATGSAKHTIGMPHTQKEKKTLSIALECSIRTLHSDLERSTAQYAFKCISAGLT